MTLRIRIITVLFYILIGVVAIWFVKINIDGYKLEQPPLTPEQQQAQWEDYYDYKHGPRG